MRLLAKTAAPVADLQSVPSVEVGAFVPRSAGAVTGHPPAAGRARVPELDGIRGVAIIMVLLLHGFAYSMQFQRWTGLAHWVDLITRPGGYGVDLFFVLSGYLITGILLDSMGKPRYFRKFYARRALRILPLYYLILILIAVCYKDSGSYVLIGAFYLSNMAPIFGIPVLYGPLWSLSVEEHFYLLWPWLIKRLKPRRIWMLALAIFLVEPVLRFITYFHTGPEVFYYSWLRFDGLAAGALLASFVRSRWYSKERLYLLGLLCAGAAVVVDQATVFGPSVYCAVPYTFAALMSLAAIAVTLSGQFPPLARFMRMRWLRRCGELSYCLYIVHWLIFSGWDRIVGEYPAAIVSDVGQFGALCIRAAAVFLVSFLVAETSYRYFEGPFLRLKRYF